MNDYFTSTRNYKLKVSSSNAIKQGLAPDGGLFVDPDLKNKKINLKKTSQLNYQDLAVYILKTLMPDLDLDDLKSSVQQAYHDSFNDDRITPLKKLKHFYCLELFHGPTSAFKDVGLQLLPRLMQHVIDPQQKVMILTATSGDTGTAALQGFKNVPQMGITVFYPHHGVSPIQARQMATTVGNNTSVAGILGNFDDAQTNVKKIFNNQKYLKQLAKQNISLSSANSINVGRLLPQVVYYFDAYNQLLNHNEISLGDRVNFTVPTGNFGDILAGYYAKQLGLPIKKLVIASNSNNVLSQFFEDGTYNRQLPFVKTFAPSMDIQVSSNFERLLYYGSHQDTNYVAQLMHDLNNNGHYQVKPAILANIKRDFAAGYTSNQQILQAIHNVYDDEHYLIDPHTAAGYHVMKQYQKQDPDVPMVLLSTASPYKFSSVVAKAVLGRTFDSPVTSNQKINQQTGVPIPKNLQQIWQATVKQPDVIHKADMLAYINRQIERIF